MIGEGSFRVEDFIQAITAQLDRVQDALRLKAVNRPLTYALKDLAMDLKVFVRAGLGRCGSLPVGRSQRRGRQRRLVGLYNDHQADD